MKKKSIGVFSLISIGVGSMIGAGIFSTMGSGITLAGRSLTIAIVIAALLVFLQCFTEFALTSAFSLPGGTYAVNALTLPKFFVGVTAINYILANFGRSVMGLTMASFLAELIPALADYQTLVAFLLITMFFLVSIPGTQFLTKVQNVMTICMYAALGLFIVYGFLFADPQAYAGEPFMAKGVSGVFAAAAVLSWSCHGAQNITSIIDDVDDGNKKVPKAFLLTFLVGGAIYVLLAFACTHAMPYAEVAGQNMGYVAQKIMPTGLYLFFTIGGALFALGTTMLGAISAMKWPIYASAEDGWLPPVFTKKTQKGFPWVVMLMMYLVAVLPVVGGFSLNSIVSLILVPGNIANIVRVFYSWNIPEKYPNTWKKNTLHMSAGVYRVMLVFSLIASATLAYFGLRNQSTSGMIGNLLMTAGLIIYSYLRYRSGKVHFKALEVNAN